MSKPKFEANQKSFSPSVQRRKMKSKESAEGSMMAGNEVLKSGRPQESPLKNRGTMKEPPSSDDRTSGYCECKVSCPIPTTLIEIRKFLRMCSRSTGPQICHRLLRLRETHVSGAEVLSRGAMHRGMEETKQSSSAG